MANKDTQLTWTTRQFKISELIPMEDNPRTITEEKEEKLDRSLEKFDLVEIPAVNQDMTIIAANQRIKRLVAKGRGEEVIDVRYPSRPLTDDEVKEYAVISNTHAGEFDFEILKRNFGFLDFEEIGFDITGFDKWKIDQDLQAAKEAIQDDYEMPKTIKTDIVPGDIIELGAHRLYCGNATEVDSYEKLMQGTMADAVITHLHIKRSGDLYQFFYDFYTAAGSYTKDGGAWYVWHKDDHGADIRKAMADAGVMVKQCLIWIKTKTARSKQDYKRQHEPCLYGWKEGAAHAWFSDRRQTTVLSYEEPDQKSKHPTMKPIPMIAYQMGNSSKRGDIILDGFGGLGTTMMAAHQMNRRCYTMEATPKLCQATIDRMTKFDPTIKIRINGK